MADRARIEATSRKRGRKISPELIEEILGALGPSVIKAVAGVPKIFISSTLSGAPSGSLGRFPTTLNVNEALEASGIAGRRIQKRANIDRPSTISSEGRRTNVGGQRPPDTELEALALSKQKAQRTAQTTRETKKRIMKRRTKMFEEDEVMIKARIEADEFLASLSPARRARIKGFAKQVAKDIEESLDKPTKGPKK